MINWSSRLLIGVAIRKYFLSLVGVINFFERLWASILLT